LLSVEGVFRLVVASTAAHAATAMPTESAVLAATMLSETAMRTFTEPLADSAGVAELVLRAERILITECARRAEITKSAELLLPKALATGAVIKTELTSARRGGVSAVGVSAVDVLFPLCHAREAGC
jgi:hypothetical protein